MRTEVTYTSDQSADYVREVEACKTLTQLRAVLEDYAPLFPDALEQCPADDSEFKVWLTGRKKERRGVFAGEAWLDRFGHIIMPTVAMHISIIADRNHAPWGQQEIVWQVTGGQR
jgi:hypothetical protein